MVSHIRPLLAWLHWLAVSFKINCTFLLEVLKYINDLAPSYISEASGPSYPPIFFYVHFSFGVGFISSNTWLPLETKKKYTH